MKLFPEFNYIFKFNLTPENSLKILKNNMNIIDLKTHKVMGKSKLFTGYFDGMNFEMKHNIEGGNSCNPKIRGTVKDDYNGCTVELNFSLYFEVKAILLLIYLFLLLSFLVTFTIFVYDIFHKRISLLFLGALLPIIIINIFVRVLMDSQITYAVEEIKKILHDKEN